MASLLLTSWRKNYRESGDWFFSGYHESMVSELRDYRGWLWFIVFLNSYWKSYWEQNNISRFPCCQGLVTPSSNLASASAQGLDLRTLFPWKPPKSRPSHEWSVRNTEAKWMQIFINSAGAWWIKMGTLPHFPLPIMLGFTLKKKLLNQANVPRDQASLLWGLGDSSNCPPLWPLAPLKCDRWTEFPWQFRHFALICVLVCILFWETNFKRGFAHRPSKLMGALSSFWAGCSSDSGQAAAERCAAGDLHQS